MTNRVSMERLRELDCGDPRCDDDVCMMARELQQARARIKELERDLAMATDAANKGDLARLNAGGMEMRIKELESELSGVREGTHVIVPREPTFEMLRAGVHTDGDLWYGGLKTAYRAMLAAREKP